MRILIIEDEYEIRELLKRILIYRGYEVDEARTGKEGLEKVKKIIPDIIITDLKMPDMDGYHMLFDMVHNLEIDLKIIVISSYFAKHHIEMCKRLGVDVFIKKPFSPEEILNAIEECI